MIEVVGVLVAAADRERASAEHIDKAVHDPRRIAPNCRPNRDAARSSREASRPHSRATAVEGSCDYLGVNGWKREWQNRNYAAKSTYGLDPDR